MTPGRAPRRATGAALVALLVVACGGPTGSVDPGDSVVLETPSASASASAAASASASGSVDPSASAAASAQPSASVAPSAGASATPRSTATPRATPTAGTGSLSQALCDLLTVANVETAMNVGGIAARPEQGDASAGYCTYLVGDRAVAGTTMLAKGAAQVMATWKPQGETVAGVGDEAVWVPSQRTLFVRKGDRLFGIQFASAGPVSAEDMKSVGTKLGQIAAARL